VGLEWGALSLTRITEELLEREITGSSLENPEINSRGDSIMLTMQNPHYLQKLAPKLAD
jgi:hypothetical protein